MNRLEFGEKTRAYITDYIKFADAKAGAIIALVSIVAGFAATSGRALLRATPYAGWPFALVLGLVGTAVVLGTVRSLWTALTALSPRTPQASESLASFPDIARLGPVTYVDRVTNLDEPGMAREYARVNAVLGQIANDKFESLRKSIWWLRVMLIAACALVVLYVFKTTT